ncbi:LysR family transcriptional regulator [Dysosmobacter sp.]|uniref:LysR family transcriptional regulator n=1 Tax=Dysosmobacter sp. TaxID=2591382 RepID=UPI003AB467A2
MDLCVVFIVSPFLFREKYQKCIAQGLPLFIICLTKHRAFVIMDKKLERGMRTMDFDSINYFLSICTSGSFSEAAKRLYISQPTLSRRITALEDELGTELFSRKSTGISLTPAGKVFYEEQTKLMNSQFRLLEKMKSFRQDYAGTLNIGIREDLSYDLILRTAMYVKSVHPNLDIRIFAYSTNDLAERYIAGQIDIAFNLRDYFPGHYPGVVETVLKISPTILIPKSHRLYDIHPLKLSDIVGEHHHEKRLRYAKVHAEHV